MAQEAIRAPYAPAQNVLSVIRQMRERGLPDIVTATTLSTAGVPDGSQPRTLVSLRFLGLIDEDHGGLTTQFERIRRASSDEYPTVLAEVIREAYAPAFTIIGDPASAGETQIDDAFRLYEPDAQRGRMVTLFLALCVEANLIPPEMATSRRPTPREPRATTRAPSGRQGRAATSRDPSADPDAPDLSAVHAIVDQLPAEAWWPDDKRTRWLRMLQGAVDYVITVRETPPSGGNNGQEADDAAKE